MMMGAAEFFRRFDDLFDVDGMTLGLESLRLVSPRGSNRSESSVAREDLLPACSRRDALLPPCRNIPPSIAGEVSLVTVTAGNTLPLSTTKGACPPALTDLVLPLLPIPCPFQNSPDER